MPHKPLVLGDTLSSHSLSPPVMVSFEAGAGREAGDAWHIGQSGTEVGLDLGQRGEGSPSAIVDVGARLALSPGP